MWMIGCFQIFVVCWHSAGCVFPCSWWRRVCLTCCAWPTCICCRVWSASAAKAWRRLCARTMWCTCGRQQSFSSSPDWRISAWSTWLRLFTRWASLMIWTGGWRASKKKKKSIKLSVLIYDVIHKCGWVCADDVFMPAAPVCRSLWSSPSWQRSSKRTQPPWRSDRPPTQFPWWTKSASTSPAMCKRIAKSKRPTRNWRPWRSFSPPSIFAAEEAAGRGLRLQVI